MKTVVIDGKKFHIDVPTGLEGQGWRVASVCPVDPKDEVASEEPKVTECWCEELSDGTPEYNTGSSTRPAVIMWTEDYNALTASFKHRQELDELRKSGSEACIDEGFAVKVPLYGNRPCADTVMKHKSNDEDDQPVVVMWKEHYEAMRKELEELRANRDYLNHVIHTTFRSDELRKELSDLKRLKRYLRPSAPDSLNGVKGRWVITGESRDGFEVVGFVADEGEHGSKEAK